MNTKTHQKLCWNCDGYVHVYEMQCPYCGVDLTDYACDQAKESENSLSQAMEQAADKVQEEVVRPPYQQHTYGHFENFEKPQEAPKEYEIKEEKDVDNPLATLLLLLPGSVLFILGISIILFSAEGLLTFQFKSKFWFVYLLGSLPLLFFGYKTLFPKKEEPKESPKKPNPFGPY